MKIQVKLENEEVLEVVKAHILHKFGRFDGLEISLMIKVEYGDHHAETEMTIPVKDPVANSGPPTMTFPPGARNAR